MKKESFVFYETWAEAIRQMPDKERLQVYDAIMAYGIYGTKTDLGGLAQLAINMIYNNIDDMKTKRQERAEKNRQNVLQRWQNNTNVYNRIQSNTNDTNGYESYHNVNGNVNGNVNDNIDTNSNSKISCSIESVYGGENENADKSAMRTQSDTPSIEKSASPKKEKSCAKKEKEPKREYGEYKNVLLTDSDAKKLRDEYGDDAVGIVQNYSEYKEMKGYKYKNDYLAIRKWGADTYYEQLNKHKSRNNGNRNNPNSDDYVSTERIVAAGLAMANANR